MEDQDVIDTADAGVPVEAGGTEEDSKWFFSKTADGEVLGSGDAPEWFQSKKYHSVEEQAKAYPELAKKLGAFTGAPDEYNTQFMGEDFEPGENFGNAVEMMQGLGVSQEAFETLMEFHTSELDALQSEVGFNSENEMAQLGDDSSRRLGNVDRYLQANLEGEEYEAAAALVTSADSVKLMEMMITAQSPKKLPSEGGHNPDNMNEQKLKDLRYAKNENGDLKMSVDSDYKAYVEGEWKKYHGNRAATQTIDL